MLNNNEKFRPLHSVIRRQLPSVIYEMNIIITRVKIGRAGYFPVVHTFRVGFQE